MIENKNHVKEGIDNLISQFKFSKNIIGLISSYLKSIQDIEGVSFDFIDTFNPYAAAGVFLDRIGETIGEKRSGRVDELYRDAIFTRILANKSGGTAEDILEILARVSPQGLTFELSEYDHASIIVDIVEDIDVNAVDLDSIAYFLWLCKSGGVRGILTANSANSFGYDAGLSYDVGVYGIGIEYNG